MFLPLPMGTHCYPIINLLISHALPVTNVNRLDLSDPSLSAIQGISDAGRSPSAAPIADPSHTQDSDSTEITKRQIMLGPGHRGVTLSSLTRIWRIPWNTHVLRGFIPSSSTRTPRAPASHFWFGRYFRSTGERSGSLGAQSKAMSGHLLRIDTYSPDHPGSCTITLDIQLALSRDYRKSSIIATNPFE